MGGTLKKKIGTPAPPKIRKITCVRAKRALKFQFLGKKGVGLPINYLECVKQPKFKNEQEEPLKMYLRIHDFQSFFFFYI